MKYTGRIPPNVAYWAFHLTRTLGGNAVYDPGEEAMWFYLQPGSFGKAEIDYLIDAAFREKKLQMNITGRAVHPPGADLEFWRQPMRVNPPMLVLGNPGITEEDASAIQEYVHFNRKKSMAAIKSGLASRLTGHVSKKQLREILKYASRARKEQKAYQAGAVRESAREKESLYDGPASTGRRRRNIATPILMAVGEKTGKVYSLDASTGAIFHAVPDFKMFVEHFANSVDAPEPLLVVKTADAVIDRGYVKAVDRGEAFVKPKWAKKHAIYRVERERRPERTHGQCPDCGHYGSDCKCHLPNPSWYRGIVPPAPQRHTPKLPAERPSDLDEAVNLGRKTGWVMVHGGDPDPRKMEALVKKLRDAKFSTDQGTDGSLWVYIGIESRYLGGLRKWKGDVNRAMQVLGLRPAFRDVNPVVDTYEVPTRRGAGYLEFKRQPLVVGGAFGRGGKQSDIEVEVWSHSPRGKLETQRFRGRSAYIVDLPYRDINPPLGDLIPPPAIAAVTKALKKHGTGPSLHKELVAILEPHRAELERRGVLVEYLAYAIEAAAGRRGNPYDPPPREKAEPDPEFWTGFEADNSTEATTLADLFESHGYTAVKQGPDADTSREQRDRPGPWVVWVYNHGLRSEKKKIERLAKTTEEFVAERRAARMADQAEEDARLAELRIQMNAEAIESLLKRQPGGRAPGELWGLVTIYGPGYQQIATNEDWESYREKMEADRSCLEQSGYRVAWTRNRAQGYLLWAMIGTEAEILSAPDVKGAYNKLVEGVRAVLRAKCRDKILHGIDRHVREPNPPSVTRKKNWEPRYWHDSWSDPVRRAKAAIRDAVYGPTYHRTEDTQGFPEWTKGQTKHPTEWDKRAIRAIVDARNSIRSKSPGRKHLGDTLGNVIRYVTRDFLQVKSNNLRHTAGYDHKIVQDWARRSLRYAESYFSRSRPDEEFVGPVVEHHPWSFFRKDKKKRYAPSADELYRRIDWMYIIARIYNSPDIESFLQEYDDDPKGVTEKAFDKISKDYYGYIAHGVKEGTPADISADEYARAVSWHDEKTKRSFAIALERKMEEVRSGDIVIDWGEE